MEKLKFSTLLFIFGAALCPAQSAFPYTQAWGTYVGGAGTFLSDYSLDESSFFVDSQQNLYVNGPVAPVPNYSAAYYNQFITPEVRL